MTFVQSDEVTWPDQKNFAMLWLLRHWLQYRQLRTWIHDNLCYLTINCDAGQYSQFLRCLHVQLFKKGKNYFLAFIPTITTINRRLQVHVCYSCVASRRSSTWQLHRTGHTWTQGGRGRGGALPRVLWCQSCSSRFFHRRHSSTICPHLSTSFRLSEPPVPPPILKQKNI